VPSSSFELIWIQTRTQSNACSRVALGTKWFALSSAHEKLDVWTGPKWHKLSKWFTICRLGMQFFMRNKIENTENYLSYLLEKWRIEIKIVCTINKNHVENILYLIPLHYPLKFNKTYFTVSDKIALSEISSPIKTSMCRFKPSLHKQILCGNFHLSQKLTRLLTRLFGCI
jgi:hypothetical protein